MLCLRKDLVKLARASFFVRRCKIAAKQFADLFAGRESLWPGAVNPSISTDKLNEEN